MKKSISVLAAVVLVLFCKTMCAAVTIDGKKSTDSKGEWSRTFNLKKGAYKATITHKAGPADEKKWATIKIMPEKEVKIKSGVGKGAGMTVASVQKRGPFTVTKKINVWKKIEGKFVIFFKTYGPWKVVITPVEGN